MKRAINNLPVIPELILIDGLYVPDGVDNAESIVKGDETHQEIAAASIYAKCYRDRLMEIYGDQYSQYSLEKNKGYPTKEHKVQLMSMAYQIFIEKVLKFNDG